jgi:hypothetical protein
MLGRNRIVRRRRGGGYELHLSGDERDLLRTLTAQLRQLLEINEERGDPSLRRLYPAAYTDDAERDAEYQRLMHSDLLAHRLGCLDVVEQTIELERLDEEQLLAWMGALNDLRLVLGTRLDVSEETDVLEPDPDDPDAAAMAVYGWLGWLLEHVIDALNPA